MILTMMEACQTYDEALAYAQSIGIAETDPSGDILGWDAAVKVAALVTVLMDTPLTPEQVARRGIDGLSLEQIETAKREGRRWKLVCTAERTPEGLAARVQPELVDPSDPLYTVMGTSSAVTFITDVLPSLTVTEGDPGPQTTATGLATCAHPRRPGIRRETLAQVSSPHNEMWIFLRRPWPGSEPDPAVQ
jgi:homoserine dehydrogenase